MKIAGHIFKCLGLMLVLTTAPYIADAQSVRKEPKMSQSGKKAPGKSAAKTARPSAAIKSAAAKQPPAATAPQENKDAKLRKEQADKITSLNDQLQSLTSQNATLSAQSKADQARIEQLTKQVEQYQSQSQSGSLGFFTTLLFIIAGPVALGYFFRREFDDLKKSIRGPSSKGYIATRDEPIFEDHKEGKDHKPHHGKGKS
jgi:hypothetical protein